MSTATKVPGFSLIFGPRRRLDPQALLGETRTNAPAAPPAGSFPYGWPLDTPWGRLRGPERIHLRDSIVAAAEKRDPSGASWTRDEKRAVDEQEQADDAAPARLHAGFVPDADDCVRCGDRGARSRLCDRCAGWAT